MDETGAGGSDAMYLTREEFFHGVETDEEDYEIPGVGTIRLRGMEVKTGLEAMGSGDDAGTRFQKVILAGVINPKLTVADLAVITDGKIGVIQDIAMAIMKLSGIEVSEGDMSAIEKQAADFLKGTPSENLSSSSAPEPSEDSPPNSEPES